MPLPKYLIAPTQIPNCPCLKAKCPCLQRQPLRRGCHAQFLPFLSVLTLVGEECFQVGFGVFRRRLIRVLTHFSRAVHSRPMVGHHVKPRLGRVGLASQPQQGGLEFPCCRSAGLGRVSLIQCLRDEETYRRMSGHGVLRWLWRCDRAALSNRRGLLITFGRHFDSKIGTMSLLRVSVVESYVLFSLATAGRERDDGVFFFRLGFGVAL